MWDRGDKAAVWVWSYLHPKESLVPFPDPIKVGSTFPALYGGVKVVIVSWL